MDLGCGSGVLSYMLAKKYKACKIIAMDSNKHAVETCQVNAASFNLNNIETMQADITKLEDLDFKLKEIKMESYADLIVSNPPWLIAKRS